MSSNKSQTRAFICPHCGRPATGEIVGEAVWDGFEGEETVNPPVEWAMLQCKRCDQPTVQIREDYGYGFDEDEPGVVYPAPRSISRSIPAPLRREWDEARICLEAKANAA